jgi:Cu/Ag efflux pump CusA
MVRKLIAWALENPLVVILLAIFLAVIGLGSFMNVNVEAYPDPAPAIVEVIALFPGASAQEVERQVTIPLEVTFAGMPGLKKINSKSLFGLSDLKMTWHYGSDYTYQTARQEVINRMSTISQPLPPNVTPAISPESPTGEIFRYVLKVPRTVPATRLTHSTTSRQCRIGFWNASSARYRALWTSPALAAPCDATRFSPTPTACAAMESRSVSSRRPWPTATPRLVAIT